MVVLAVFREEVIPLGDWRADPRGGVFVEFDRPARIAGKHARLETPSRVELRLNSETIPGAPARSYSGIGDSLGVRNRLWCASDPGPARLILTPRVFISEAVVQAGEAELTADVTVRNTLDNTVNVIVEVRKPGTPEGPSAVATIGPGVTQTVEVRGKLEGVRSGEPLEIWVEKDEEAMEGAYRYVGLFNATSGTGKR
ncbi:MAG: hypothetical protein FJW39_00625 [Acidobacteria bacterium]|nr:hypothetical protein [Acidobacteriota bacterium]